MGKACKSAAGGRSLKLFSWFADWFGRLYGRNLSGRPADVLRALDVPVAAYPWLDSLSDAEYPLKETENGLVPNLERRQNLRRRNIGQYYTPANLVKSLLRETKLAEKNGPVLDPACGDGAFLVPLIECKRELGILDSLNQIYGIDLDAEALLVCLARILAAAPRLGTPVLECRDFLLDPPPRAFGAILGNPPYKVNLPSNMRDELAKRYVTAEGEKDLYTFFLENALRKLEPGGTLLMLTSHTWLVNHQCAKLRRFVFEDHAPQKLFLLPARFFTEAPGVIPIVIEVTAAKAASGVFSVYDEYDKNGFIPCWHAKREAHAENFVSSTGIAAVLRDSELNARLNAMSADNPKLGEIASVGVGIQESVKRGKSASEFVHDEPIGSNPVKVLRGREIEPFRVRWSGKYLDYGPHLAYAGKPDAFKNPKILYQNLRHETLPVRLVAALDDEGFFPKNSLSYISQPIYPFTLEYIAGLLNSPIVNAWFAARYFSFHITVTQVRSIPVPLADARRRGLVEELSRNLKNTPPETALPSKLLDELSKAVLACYF